MYKNILVAIDGQELSNKALTQAIGFAKALGAKMTVLNVTPRWSAGAAGGDVERAGLSSLKEGQKVKYEIARDRGKDSAANLSLVE